MGGVDFIMDVPQLLLGEGAVVEGGRSWDSTISYVFHIRTFIIIKIFHAEI
jgi:hypothetical protein